MTPGWYVVTPKAASRKHRRRSDADALRGLAATMGREYLGPDEIQVVYASSQAEARSLFTQATPAGPAPEGSTAPALSLVHPTSPSRQVRAE